MAKLKDIKYSFDDLPRIKNRKLIDWQNTKGYKIKYEYRGFTGEILITDVFKDCTKDHSMQVTLKHYNMTKTMPANILYDRGADDLIINPYLSRCKNIGELITCKKTKRQFIIVGISTQKIKDGTIKREQPFYRIRCINCGNEKIIPSSRLYNPSCNVCENLEIVYGINDITTTDPWMIPYFKNKEKAMEYGSGTRKTFVPICPRCKREHNKPIKISLFKSMGGFSCRYCSDSIPCTEKIMISLLNQLGIDYYYQAQSDILGFDCKRKKYDFYIPSMLCIIETHGLQHYMDARFGSKLVSSKQNKVNDMFKKENALKNGIKYYIEIDCRKSDLEWIKKSILQSDLPTLLNFKEDDINWELCKSSLLSSFVIDVCNDYHRNFLTIDELANKYHFCNSTIEKYLKIGSELNLCTHNRKVNTYKKPIELLKDDKHVIFAKNNTDLKNKSKGKIDCNKLSYDDILMHCKNGESYHGYIIKFVEDVPTRWDILSGKYDDEFIAC